MRTDETISPSTADAAASQAALPLPLRPGARRPAAAPRHATPPDAHSPGEFAALIRDVLAGWRPEEPQGLLPGLARHGLD